MATASDVLDIPEKEENPIFEDLGKLPEVEVQTYPIKVKADQDAIQARAQQLFSERYSDKEGYGRTWGQLLPQTWLISMAKEDLINQGVATRERLGWSPQDVENLELALEKYNFFKDLPQDRATHDAIKKRMEESALTSFGLARGVREAGELQRDLGAQGFGRLSGTGMDPDLQAYQSGEEETEERALEFEDFPRRRAGRERRRAALSLAGFRPDLPELPREFFPLLEALDEGWLGGKRFINKNLLNFLETTPPEEGAETLKEIWEANPFLGFGLLQMFGPRNPSSRQAKHILKQGGVPVKNVWQIDHKYLDAGLVVELEDGSRYLYNSPDITESDVLQFIGTEAFPLLLDIVLTGKAGRAMSAFKKGDLPHILTSAVRGLKLAGVSAGATGVGEYVRLMIGSLIGAHDMSEAQMTDEILGEMAVAGIGSTAMLSAFGAISGIRRLFKPEPPGGWFRDMVPAIARWEELNKKPFPFINEKIKRLFPEYSEEGTTVAKFFQDHPQSLTEIEELLEKFAIERVPGKKNIWQASIGRQVGADSALSAEADLMLMAKDNPMIASVFKTQILHGNKVAMTLLKRMHGGEFPTGVNADELATLILKELNIKKAAETLPYSQVIRATTREPLRQFEGRVGETYRDADLLVPGLWREGDTPAGMFVPRPTGGQALAEEIKVAPREALETALKNPEYQGGVDMSASLQKSFKQWLQLKEPGDKTMAFRDPRVSEGIEAIFDLVPNSITSKGDIYNRLFELAGYKRAPKLDARGKVVTHETGRNKGKTVMVEIPELGPLTLDELNTMRLVLNYMVGTADVGMNPTLRKLWQDTNRRLGREIDRLKNTLASKRSGSAPNSPANKKWIEDNEFMEDIKLGWLAQRDAIEVSRYAFTQAIKAQDPSRFMHNLLRTYRNTGKSKLPDQELSEVIENLERIGRHEDVRDIRGVVVEYIREGLKENNKTLLEQRNAYQLFLQEYTPFLKALFPAKDFGSLNKLTGFLDNAVEKVERLGLQVAEIEGRYGKKITNIVSDYLNKNPDISAGKWKAEIDDYVKLIEDSPALQEETKQVAWNWMLYDVDHGILVGDRFQGGRVIDPQRLNALFEGFRTGGDETHQLESYFGKLLGKEGPEYIRALRKLNTIVQQQSTIPPSLRGLSEAGDKLEPQTKFFERIFIAPLTKFGRRMTAIRGKMGQRAQVIATNALHDPELLGKLMRLQGRRITIKQYLSALTAWDVAHNYDLAAEGEEDPLDPEATGYVVDFFKAIPGLSLYLLRETLEGSAKLIPEGFVTEDLPNLPARREATGTDG